MSLMDSLLTVFGRSGENNLPSFQNQMEEGVNSATPEQELNLKLKDEDLLSLSRKWKSNWDGGTEELTKTREIVYKYWKGEQKHAAINKLGENPPIDNVLFESLETFLPQATKSNPEPYVYVQRKNLAKLDEEQKKVVDQYTKHVKELLADEADTKKLRLKLKSATRKWSLSLIGIIKTGYGEDGVYAESIHTKDIILDSTASCENGDYTGKYVGQLIKIEASKLVARYPEKEQIIKASVKGKMGTEIVYTEWWTNDYFFATYKGNILGKFLNPNYNYENIETIVNSETGEEEQDVTPAEHNHYKTPRHPFHFLTVFNIGNTPWDDTGLMQQNIGMQDTVNKRLQQIDRNADAQNNGIVLNGEVFDDNQASIVAQTLADGGYLRVPGNIEGSYKRDQAPALTGDVYNQLADVRSEMKNIFGTKGLSAQGIQSDRTVGGKILSQQVDTTRIGGGVTEYIEQLADSVYNYWYQLLLVYEPELFQEMEKQAIIISVKEGSLIPKDEMTKRNEAIDLWAAGAIDPLTFAERLDMPDPEEYVRRLTMWQQNPQGMLQDDERSLADQVDQSIQPQQEIMPQ